MKTAPSLSPSDADVALCDLLEELTQKHQRGELIDHQAILEAYPQYADRLQFFLPALKLLAELSRTGASSPTRLDDDELARIDGVLGDFRILREVGRGGMGVVYEAEQLSLGRRVALKVLPFAGMLDERQLQRFKNESRAAASLHHPNIVPIHSVGCERGVHYYAMQYIEGQTLADVIRQLRLEAGIEDPQPPHEESGMPAERVSPWVEDLRSGRLAGLGGEPQQAPADPSASAKPRLAPGSPRPNGACARPTASLTASRTVSTFGTSPRARRSSPANRIPTGIGAWSTTSRPESLSLRATAAGVRGQTLTFTLGASDPSPVDQAAGFTYEIDWNGDGTVDETVSGPSGLEAPHVFSQEGSYTVTVTARDKDGGVSAAASLSVTIHVVALLDDPLDPAKKMLAVGGTSGNDHIVFNSGAAAGDVKVILNGVTLGEFQPTSRLLAFGLEGNDMIQSASLSWPWFYGGPGNDDLKGGDGHDLLFGEAGDDLLVGKSGRDLLVGGEGYDRIVGNADEDILIGAYTGYDRVESALALIMAEWTSARSYDARVANLRGEGSGTDWDDRSNGHVFLTAEGAGATVLDDGVKDTMTGGADQDWFFANLENDKITDLDDDEFADDLDWILAP